MQASMSSHRKLSNEHALVETPSSNETIKLLPGRTSLTDICWLRNHQTQKVKPTSGATEIIEEIENKMKSVSPLRNNKIANVKGNVSWID